MASINIRTLKLRCDYDTLLELEGNIEYAKSKAQYDELSKRWRCEEDISIPLGAILVIDRGDDDIKG